MIKGDPSALIGTVVVLNTGSPYLSARDNPAVGSKHACAGTITGEAQNLDVTVSWDNGTQNAYRFRELTPLDRTTVFKIRDHRGAKDNPGWDSPMDYTVGSRSNFVRNSSKDRGIVKLDNRWWYHLSWLETVPESTDFQEGDRVVNVKSGDLGVVIATDAKGFAVKYDNWCIDRYNVSTKIIRKVDADEPTTTSTFQVGDLVRNRKTGAKGMVIDTRGGYQRDRLEIKYNNGCIGLYTHKTKAFEKVRTTTTTEEVKQTKKEKANMDKIKTVVTEHKDKTVDAAQIAAKLVTGQTGITLLKERIKPVLGDKYAPFLDLPEGEYALAHVISLLLGVVPGLADNKMAQDITEAMLLAASVKELDRFDIPGMVNDFGVAMGLGKIDSMLSSTKKGG